MKKQIFENQLELQLTLEELVENKIDKVKLLEEYNLLFSELSSRFKKNLNMHDIPDKYLKINQMTNSGVLKNAHTFVFNGEKIIETEYFVTKGIRIYLSLKLSADFGYYEFVTKKDVIYMEIKEYDIELVNFLEEKFSVFIANYVPSETFGCCSKYVECSNNLSCLHADKFHSKGCLYKANLENGKIFYGVNKKC